MTEVSHEQIRTEVAELRATVLNELKHLSHDVKNISQRTEALVSRREMEEKIKVVKDDVDELKDEHKFVRRAVYSAWIAGLGFAGLVGRKLGVV
jgi:hypothetical protein